MAAKRALLIGPSYSSDLPSDICGPLQGVENDVRLMKDMLCKSGFQLNDIETLLGDEASRDNILSSLEKLSFSAEKGSVVIIYFSGHGYQLTHEYDQGLLPAGLTRQMVDQYHVYDVCITGEQLKPHLLRLIQKDCLVNTIFDCCFSGRLYRGYGAKESPSLKPKMLKLSDEYINNYCEKLKSEADTRLKQREPVEQCDDLAFSSPESLSTALSSLQLSQESTEPNKHESYQETQPPSPMKLPTQLKHPVQEFWNRMLKGQGWKPSHHDKFVHIAASACNQKGYEIEVDRDTQRYNGCLTLALVEAIDEARQENMKISYSILKSLMKRKFVEKDWKDQTPQFEGGKMDLALFSTVTVPQVKGFEICEVKEEAGLYKVTLNAGHLHGVVEGEYDVCRPEIPNETAASRNREKIYRYCIDTIAINRGEIDMLRSRGSTAYKSDDRKIRVGCKAVLNRRHSMFTPVLVVAPPDLPAEDKHRMDLSIESQNMFNLEVEERPHCVTLDIKIVEDKQCWRACQYGRMIVPYQLAGDEHLMAKNLSKYFRLKFALNPKYANDHMLTKVSFKVFKVENVPSFKGSPDKKNELITNAIKTPDLSIGDTPTFRAHKVELENSLAYRRRYKVVDGSGDALVIQVTNNEDRYIHVCIISYQADGSIVVLHPPRKGNTEVMEPTESITTIKRVLLEPDTARRMLEPDFDKERPICCKDVMILYATTEPTDYEPLTQTAIELSPKLSTRGPNKPDGLLLATSYQFRNALRPRRDHLQPARDGHTKWLTIKREIDIQYND